MKDAFYCVCFFFFFFFLHNFPNIIRFHSLVCHYYCEAQMKSEGCV